MAFPVASGFCGHPTRADAALAIESRRLPAVRLVLRTRPAAIVVCQANGLTTQRAGPLLPEGTRCFGVLIPTTERVIIRVIPVAAAVAKLT